MSTLTTPDADANLLRLQTAQQTRASKAPLPAADHVSDEDKAKLRQKAKEFEAFFIYQSMELMKSEIDSEFSGGYGEDMFRHTLNEEMAKNVTEAGGIGIADTIYAELLKNQENRNAALAAAKAAGAAYSGVAR